MANEIRTGNPCGFNKGLSSQFREGSRVHLKKAGAHIGWNVVEITMKTIVRKPFGNCIKNTNYKCHFHVLQYFQSPSYIEVFFFNCTLWSTETANSTILQVTCFVDYCKVWSSGRLAMIKGSVCISKTPEKFVCLILQDIFSVVHIPFFRMVKFQFLAQFQVDHLSCPMLSCLIFFQCYLTVFAYYVIDRFISITT